LSPGKEHKKFNQPTPTINRTIAMAHQTLEQTKKRQNEILIGLKPLGDGRSHGKHETHILRCTLLIGGANVYEKTFFVRLDEMSIVKYIKNAAGEIARILRKISTTRWITRNGIIFEPKKRRDVRIQADRIEPHILGIFSTEILRRLANHS
jgi:hypothetical protein